MITYIVNNLDVIDRGDSILKLSDGSYYSLNATGQTIWRLLGEPLALEDLLEHVAASYGLPPDAVQVGVESLWRQLIEEGLIIPCEGERTPLEPAKLSDYSEPRLVKLQVPPPPR